MGYISDLLSRSGSVRAVMLVDGTEIPDVSLPERSVVCISSSTNGSSLSMRVYTYSFVSSYEHESVCVPHIRHTLSYIAASPFVLTLHYCRFYLDLSIPCMKGTFPYYRQLWLQRLNGTRVVPPL